VKIRVYYEDTDTGGIVYHTNYIKYCERARSELFFSNDMLPINGEKRGFVVKKIDANFIGSAVLGDILNIKSKLLKIRHASAVLRQEVFKKEEKLFEMDIVLVYMEREKITHIPETFESVLSMLRE